MNRNKASVFGYNEYSKQIVQQIHDLYNQITVFVMSDEEYAEAAEDGLSVEKFDLSDEWENFSAEQHSVVFCTLDNDAENVFLTISLRAAFEHLLIIALAQDNESMMKMKSAGADQVMPILQLASNVISDILGKPIVTKVLHDIVHERGNLRIDEITVTEDSPLVEMYVHDVHFKRSFDLVLLAIVDQEMGTTFSFSSKGINHHIDAGDILVLVGESDKLSAFKAWAKG